MLHMVGRLRGGMVDDGNMKIFVKTSVGKKTFTMDVNKDDTVENLKDKIYELTQCPTSEQRLIFDDKEMENDDTLSNHNIQAESMVYLTVRARGGGGAKPGPTKQ
eukprot:7089657-Heterocapsa_arctica.AAC.1